MLPVAKALHRGYPTPLGRALSRLHHLCSQGRQRQLGRRVDPKGGLGNAAFHMVPFERSGGLTCRGKFSLPLLAPVVRSRRHTRLSLIAQEPTVADRPVGSRQQVLAHLLSTHSHGFGSHVEMKRLRPTWMERARSGRRDCMISWSLRSSRLEAAATQDELAAERNAPRSSFLQGRVRVECGEQVNAHSQESWGILQKQKRRPLKSIADGGVPAPGWDGKDPGMD